MPETYIDSHSIKFGSFPESMCGISLKLTNLKLPFDFLDLENATLQHLINHF